MIVLELIIHLKTAVKGVLQLDYIHFCSEEDPNCQINTAMINEGLQGFL